MHDGRNMKTSLQLPDTAVWHFRKKPKSTPAPHKLKAAGTPLVEAYRSTFNLRYHFVTEFLSRTVVRTGNAKQVAPNSMHQRALEAALLHLTSPHSTLLIFLYVTCVLVAYRQTFK